MEKLFFLHLALLNFHFCLTIPRVKYNYNDWEVILASSTGGVAYLPSELGSLWNEDSKVSS